ncbi:hypothetical protein TNIN_249991 [Trichonephila inaurata madagascariensis]|uniref:Uncharacterized protein n=1 Tax=Trichonephila inaurata madagascariensis TaxID=2747483 RepID=A0A8X6XBJ4_9ARAC|nr:hypothetical protein TNIN_249991 [Trichonephila inaurata madagascariensis]
MVGKRPFPLLLHPTHRKRSDVKYACEGNRSLANTPQLRRSRERRAAGWRKKTKKMMQRVGNRWDGGKIGVEWKKRGALALGNELSCFGPEDG